LFFISAFFGLSGIIGSLGGGKILDQFGGVVLYRLLSYFSFAGCLGLFAYKTYSNKKVIVA
jgi:PPP family 3-phenylpropionic acid transporter